MTRVNTQSRFIEMFGNPVDIQGNGTSYVGDYCNVISGFPFKSELFNEDKAGKPLIRIRDVARGYTETYTTEECEPQYVVRAGDLLVGMDGNFTISAWQSDDALLNQRVCMIIPKNDSITRNFIIYAIQPVLTSIEEKTNATTVKHISASQISSIAISAIEKSSVLEFDSIIQQADKSKFSKLYFCFKSRFIEMFGSAGKENFPVKKLGNMAECFAGATPSTSVNEYWENGTIPWMSSGEVHLVHVDKTEAKITQCGYDHASTKMVPIHSVVIALAGQGKTRGTVAITEIPLCTNQSLCAIVPGKEIHYEYLFHNLNGRYLELRGMAGDVNGRGGLNLKIIQSIPIAVPPMSIQKEFVKIAHQADKSKYLN